jgi:hypothetical protein
MLRTWGIEPDEPAGAPEPELELERELELELELDTEPEPADLPSRRFDAWRRRSAIGGLATGVALGLQEVFYPTDNEPVITAEAPGDPPDADQRLRVILDPDDPTKSMAILPAGPAAEPPAEPPPAG